MNQPDLEFLLHADWNPYNIHCGFYSFAPGDTVDYAKAPRKQTLIHLLLEGERAYYFDGKCRIFDAHSILFIPDGTHYITVSQESNRRPCRGASLLFSVDATLTESLPHTVYSLKTFENSEIEADFFSLCQLCATSPTQQLQKKLLALKIIEAVISSIVSGSADSSFLAPAIAYIRAHFRENRPVADYASTCNLSESHFRKRFRDTFGMSPIEYRNRLRFSEARRLYQAGHTMKTIAEQVGFCDENHLSRLYKKAYGHSLKKDGYSV